MIRLSAIAVRPCPAGLTVWSVRGPSPDGALSLATTSMLSGVSSEPSAESSTAWRAVAPPELPALPEPPEPLPFGGGPEAAGGADGGAPIEGAMAVIRLLR